ncbi:60S ribosomal protein L22 [Cyclospora cayetanensis]|uniref:Large ribosomal subunit protein eL22 n=2 Tax=Cyclospora cayetanensis TaxID=88456 RepID=A0A1D3D2L5_9EIME|nr:60S ribosomal protein L22 [Cyclospora cayetanensis]OEH77678.1 60s ribosomal protein [Cyclospora cayetanensis]
MASASVAAPARSLAQRGKKPAFTGKTTRIKFTIDCQKPVDDNILEAKGLENFLRSRIKVAGKLNNLREKIEVSREKAKVCVTAELPFSKRYLKYLVKKYLKKHMLRDFLRVVANNKTSYELRYFQMPQEDEETA